VVLVGRGGRRRGGGGGGGFVEEGMCVCVKKDFLLDQCILVFRFGKFGKRNADIIYNLVLWLCLFWGNRVKQDHQHTPTIWNARHDTYNASRDYT
jgi:hypothetical protein